MSCLWCSEGTNKHRMRAESCTLIGYGKQIVSARGRHDWTNKNRKRRRSSDWEKQEAGARCGSLCVGPTLKATSDRKHQQQSLRQTLQLCYLVVAFIYNISDK